jgi:hypothetical protein
MWHKEKGRNEDWVLVRLAEGEIQFEGILKRVFKKEQGKCLL